MHLTFCVVDNLSSILLGTLWSKFFMPENWESQDLNPGMLGEKLMCNHFVMFFVPPEWIGQAKFAKLKSLIFSWLDQAAASQL